MIVRPAMAPGGDRWLLNQTQYTPGQRRGHYESFYQRANHPQRPLAFWIRYTIFAPDGDPGSAVGELWSVFFDGESGRHAVAKEEHPIGRCQFRRDSFSARIASAHLGPNKLVGSAAGTPATAAGTPATTAGTSATTAGRPATTAGRPATTAGPGDSIAWDLRFEVSERPVLLLPPRLYSGGIAKAKTLVAAPNARYDGALTVNSDEIAIDGWMGSQNHNWGSRHADHYAFAQVVEFDNEPGSFLELVTAKSKIVGPLGTPFFTFLVLRLRGKEYALTSLRHALRASSRFGYFHWDFESADDGVRVGGRITAERDAFVGLHYRNPPGGSKHCLNTKIASAELTVRDRRAGSTVTLRTANRALFEILTDDRSHGVTMRA